MRMLIRRALCLMVSISAALALLSPASAASFRDVPNTHWAYGAICEMQEAGLVNGVGNGSFDPGGQLSRAQFLAMAVRLLEQETGEHATPASSGNYWAAPYYTAAEHFHLFGGGSKNAITLSGIQNSRKSLDTAVTRYEMAVLANNVLANAPGYHFDTSGVSSAVMPDYTALPSQYKDAVCRMYSLGILTGQAGGYFNGSKPLTRAESCAVLSRLRARFAAMGSGGNAEAAEGFAIHFIDVGQADAALVLCDGEAMLIDGGNAADSDLIYAYLKQQNVSNLKYMVGTHAHEDHMGGLAGALQYAKVGMAFCSVTQDDAKFFQNIVKYLNQQGKRLTVPQCGSTYSLGSAQFQFLGPVRPSDDPNNMSLVLRITYGDTSFLFTGDAERDEEADILKAGYPLKSTVLKAGHHGSETSTSYPFLRAVAPQYGVISCGAGNSYGHPHDAALSRLRDADVTLYRTDLQGTIVCTSDGKTVRFTPSKNPAIQTNPTEHQSSSYIGNRSSHVFHRPSCANLPLEKNRIYFVNRSDAVASGYTPCSKCKP